MSTITKYVGIFLLFTFIATSAIAQTNNGENPQNDLRYKDPSTAQLWGIVITGGGHFYAGESGTGAILLGTGVLAPIIGAGLSSCDLSGCNYGPLYIGAAAAVGSWIYSIVDAPKAAKRTNEANGLTMSSKIQVSPRMLTTKTNYRGYGVEMRINF